MNDWTWLLGLAGIAGFFYGIAPLFILSSQSLAAELDLTPTRVEDLPAGARESLRQFLEAFWAQGFVVVSNCRAASTVPNVLGVQVLLIQPESRDIGYGIFSSSAAGALRAWMVTIRTRFADGTQIVTSSSTQPGVSPANPTADAVYVNWIKDPARLYRIHRARVVSCGRAGDPRMLPAPERAVQYQQDEWREEIDRLIDTGYYRQPGSGGKCAMTVKGAYIMTWRLLWPVKQLRQLRRRVSGWRAIRRLGV